MTDAIDNLRARVIIHGQTTEEPSNELRWKAGRMQQLWYIIDWSDDPKPTIKEWRDVPTYTDGD